MSDENIKTDTDDNVDAEAKSETVKKPAAASKKAKAKSNDNSDKDENNKKIAEKLQAMGVMSGGKSNAEKSDNPQHAGLLKLSIAVVVAVTVVGSFVWALNKEATNQQVASNAYNNTAPSAYPGAWQASSSDIQNTNTRYPAFNHAEQQQRIQQQREQQQKWMQQQQQVQEQQRAQQQKWAQQQPTQEQFRNQQQKWAEQQQRQAQQQRVQQQKWGQQQQTYYGYPPSAGYQGQTAQSYYNNTPRYQQPGPYYGPQY